MMAYIPLCNLGLQASIGITLGLFSYRSHKVTHACLLPISFLDLPAPYSRVTQNDTKICLENNILQRNTSPKSLSFLGLSAIKMSGLSFDPQIFKILCNFRPASFDLCLGSRWVLEVLKFLEEITFNTQVQET